MQLHEVRVADVFDQGHRQRAIRLEPVGRNCRHSKPVRMWICICPMA